jgi:hypothetical protein
MVLAAWIEGQTLEKLTRVTDTEVRALGLLADEVWRNDVYLVSVMRAAGKWEGRTVVHLSIKRHDAQPVTDWPEKQAIKNQLVGENCEGLEVYPAESRKHDQVNRYHLWVIADPTYRLPFGWSGRATADDDAKGELVEE